LSRFADMNGKTGILIFRLEISILTDTAESKASRNSRVASGLCKIILLQAAALVAHGD